MYVTIHPCVHSVIISISSIPLLPSCFLSIHQSVYAHSSIHIHPVPHPPTYYLCSLTSTYAFTLASQLLFLPIIPIHLSRSIPTPFIHHATFPFTQLCSNCTLSIHVCHLLMRPSSIHLPIIYLYHLSIFLYVYPYKFHNICL